MAKERKENSFIKKPIYKGGQQALKSFIATNLVYPEEAIKQKIEGTVKVKIDIDHRGKVIKVKVISGLGYGCNEEAIRLVKLLKFEIPKNPRKLKIVFHKNMQIHFKLAKKPEPVQQQIKYEISTSKPAEKPNGSTTYGYTIDF